MNLSTNVITHVIITYTGGHYKITEQQEKILQRVGQDQIIEVEGNKIKGRNISEVMTIEKYHETFPNKKPEYHNYPKLPEYEENIFTKSKRIKSLESIIAGFKKHFGNKQIPSQSIAMLNKMKEKLEEAKITPEDKIFNNPVTDLTKFL